MFNNKLQNYFARYPIKNNVYWESIFFFTQKRKRERKKTHRTRRCDGMNADCRYTSHANRTRLVANSHLNDARKITS